MTILVTGATGNVGRNVVEQLVKRGADVRALVRDTTKATFPPGVAVVQGDLLDVDALRSAFRGVSTLFLLNGVVADEFTQALVALKDVVTNHGRYPMPIGNKGIAMIDARDVGEVAAVELIRREQSSTQLPLDPTNLVGPDTLTGTGAAAVWSEVLGRKIAYPGDDTAGLEQNLRNVMPGWMALDMRLMAERFVRDGMIPAAGDVDRLTRLLGRPLRSYREYVAGITA
ncbi:MAG: NmrA family transcriptional regulator [Labilithrix sp.]|nr:NmrA family transcriptional regulator [Labilithrix sp.]